MDPCETLTTTDPDLVAMVMQVEQGTNKRVSRTRVGIAATVEEDTTIVVVAYQITTGEGFSSQ